MPEIKVKIGKGMLAELAELSEDLEVTRGETIRTFLRLGLDTFWDSQAEDEDEDEDEDEEDEEAEMEADEKEEAKKD